MNIQKIASFALLVTTVTLIVLATPVLAEQNHSGSSNTLGQGINEPPKPSQPSSPPSTASIVPSDAPKNTSGAATETNHQGSTIGSSTDPNKDNKDTPDDQKNEALSEVHSKAAELLAEARKGHASTLTAEQKQKACVAHQADITAKLKNYTDNAAKHLTTFSGVLTKATAFYASKQLTVDGYDAALATAQAKGAAATAAVRALQAMSGTFDCTQADPASGVATIKAAVANARGALQAYRLAVKDVVTLLKNASAAQDNTAGGNQ